VKTEKNNGTNLKITGHELQNTRCGHAFLRAWEHSGQIFSHFRIRKHCSRTGKMVRYGVWEKLYQCCFVLRHFKYHNASRHTPVKLVFRLLAELWPGRAIM